MKKVVISMLSTIVTGILFVGCGPSETPETPEEAEVRVAKKCDILEKKAHENLMALTKQLETDLAAGKIIKPQMDLELLKFRQKNPTERSIIFLRLEEADKKNLSPKLKYELEKKANFLQEQVNSELKQLSESLPAKIAEAKKEKQEQMNFNTARILLKKYSPLASEFINKRYPFFLQATKSTGAKGLFNQHAVFENLSSLVFAENLMKYARNEKDFSELPKDLQERILFVASTSGKEKDLNDSLPQTFDEMVVQSKKKYPEAWKIISLKIKDSDLKDEFEFVRDRSKKVDLLCKEKGITQFEADKVLFESDIPKVKRLLLKYSVAADAVLTKYAKELSDTINRQYPAPEYNNLDRKDEFKNLLNLIRRKYIDDLTMTANEIKYFSGKAYVDARNEFFREIHVFENKKIFNTFDTLPSDIKNLNVGMVLNLIKKNWTLAEEEAKQQNISVEKAYLKRFQ